MKSVRFIGSFPSLSQVPDLAQPQYAFIGRSNVGKSSLINMLTGRKSIAKVSKQPGKTQLINLFMVDDSWLLVDLPGYGYAKESKRKRARWEKMVRNYLIGSDHLVNTFVLLDSNIPGQQIDLDFINWMGENRLPFSIVYTKIDRVKKSKIPAHIKAIRSTLLEYWESLPPEFLASSVSGEGQETILTYIEELNAEQEQ